jgi:hypothetical protein
LVDHGRSVDSKVPDYCALECVVAWGSCCSHKNFRILINVLINRQYSKLSRRV